MVIIGVVWLGFANETLDVLAHMLGASEWQLWIPPFPNYEIPGFEGGTLLNLLLGIAFVVVVMVATFGIMWLLVKVRSRRRQDPKSDSTM